MSLEDGKHSYLADLWAQVRLGELHAMLGNVIIIQKTARTTDDTVW